MGKQYQMPLYRYKITEKYYILLSTRLNKAEVGIMEDPDAVNDFLLWHGFKTIQTFTAETPRKAYNKAKKWILRQTAEFKEGEVVWFYPDPTCHPKRREKKPILEVRKVKAGKLYRVHPVNLTLFPTFHFASQFEKIHGHKGDKN